MTRACCCDIRSRPWRIGAAKLSRTRLRASQTFTLVPHRGRPARSSRIWGISSTGRSRSPTDRNDGTTRLRSPGTSETARFFYDAAEARPVAREPMRRSDVPRRTAVSRPGRRFADPHRADRDATATRRWPGTGRKLREADVIAGVWDRTRARPKVNSTILILNPSSLSPNVFSSPPPTMTDCPPTRTREISPLLRRSRCGCGSGAHHDALEADDVRAASRA